jgi:hypothetical protein
MARVLAVFDTPLQLSNDRIYTAQACGRQREDGRWEGWLEFMPDDTSVVLRTERETTQRNLADLEHWASTLTPVYLQGALERALTPPPPVIVDEPVIPSIYDEPAPSRAGVTPTTVADTAPPLVLDPFVEIVRGEEEFARKLARLTREELYAIIAQNNLADASVDLEAMTIPQLVGWIVGAVRWRLAS